MRTLLLLVVVTMLATAVFAKEEKKEAKKEKKEAKKEEPKKEEAKKEEAKKEEKKEEGKKETTVVLIHSHEKGYESHDDKEEKEEEEKEGVKRGPGAQFLYTVRQRLSALHLQLSVDFRALSACKSAACRAAARSRIRDVKRAELLVRRARGHIRLGRIFRDAAKCTNSHCRARLRREVREEQRKMRMLIRRGANERAKEAKAAAARLARRAHRAEQHAAHAKKIAHHLNRHEKHERASRFLHMARHFHGLGLLYAKAADCRSHRCERRYLKRIRAYREQQRDALERMHQQNVLDALKRARDASHDLAPPKMRYARDMEEGPLVEPRLFKEWNDVDDVDAVYAEDEHNRRIRREVAKLIGTAKEEIKLARRHPNDLEERREAKKAIRKAKKAIEEAKEEMKEDKEEPKKDSKVEKAKKVAKKLAKKAEEEAKQLERAADEAPKSVAKELKAKAELDKQLEKEFKKAAKCESKDCIKEKVERVKEIKEKADKE